MLTKTREGNKKVPLPVALHLIRAVGALTLHTGRNYILTDKHKKCSQHNYWRASSPLSNVTHYKDEGSFREKQEIGRKKKRFATFHGG